MDIKYNLDLARGVMSEKGDICQNIKVGESCTIQDFNDSTVIDTLKLTRYAMSNEYQYTLQFELLFLGDEEIDMESHKILESISWTEDEKHVFSKMSLEDTQIKDISWIDYMVMENGDENMSIYNDIVFKNDKQHDKFNLEIIKSHIEGNYIVNSHIESVNMAMFDSYTGELNRDGGYINSIRGEAYGGFRLSEYVTFDATGKILSVKVCESGIDRCDTDDPLAVLEYCENID